MNYSVPLITANPYYLDDLTDMLLTETEFLWDDSHGAWKEYTRETLFWSHTGIGIEENLFDDIKIYPVPTKDKIHIELSSFEPTTVRLVDLNGRIMQEKQTNSITVTLHVEEYSSGLYFLMIERNGNAVVQKVVIQ